MAGPSALSTPAAIGAGAGSPADPHRAGERDHDLAQRAAAGDRTASDRIGELCHDRVVAYLRSLGASPEQAEELVQEVFLPTNLRTFRGDSALLTYLCAIARRKLQRLRGGPRSAVGRAAAATGSLDELRDASGYEPLATSATPHHTAAVNELADRVRELLDERESAILELRIHAGLGFADVAAQLGLKTNTVKSLYRRAVERLRARLRLDDDPPPG